MAPGADPRLPPSDCLDCRDEGFLEGRQMDQDYSAYYPPLPLLVIWIALWISLAVGNGFLARALGKHVVLWVILSLIPIVNGFFYIYIVYAVILGILARLNAITARSGVVVDT
jgi:hypothetical protein